MTKNHLKEQLSVILFLAMAIVMCLLWLRLNRLEEQLNTVRFALPGRTKESVIGWLGKPSREGKNVKVAGRMAATVMYYSSTVPGKRPDAASDIWVVLDKTNRVEMIYYPDISLEKNFLDAMQ